MLHNIEYISSLQNPKIKQLLKLRDKRRRDETGLFLIEGYRELLRANAANVSFYSLYFCEEFFLKDNEVNLISAIQRKGIPVYSLTKSAFAKISYRDRPDGLLAVAQKELAQLEDLKVTHDSLYVVVEKIEKPGNLGTILRSCDGVGVSGLIVCDHVTDITNPNVVRASTGTLFTQKVIEASSEETRIWLHNHGIKTVATSPAASHCYTDISYSGPLAIIMGSEQYGLMPEWLSNCDEKVYIPMKGEADSLNVAMATTLMLYEALRQRSSHA